MKGTTLALTLISALLFSAVALFQLFSLVSANPYDGTPTPSSFQTPNKDPPAVTIQSPCNTIYCENEVLLNFTVTQPDSWFKANVSCWIKGVTYQLDSGQVVTLFEPASSLSELPATKQFSIVLKGVTLGQHTLQVNVTAESQYCPNPTYFFFLVQHYPLDVSQKINFMVIDLRIIGIAIVAVVAVVAVGVLVYFKKRRRQVAVIGQNE